MDKFKFLNFDKAAPYLYSAALGGVTGAGIGYSLPKKNEDRADYALAGGIIGATLPPAIFLATKGLIKKQLKMLDDYVAEGKLNDRVIDSTERLNNAKAWRNDSFYKKANTFNKKYENVVYGKETSRQDKKNMYWSHGMSAIGAGVLAAVAKRMVSPKTQRVLESRYLEDALPDMISLKKNLPSWKTEMRASDVGHSIVSDPAMNAYSPYHNRIFVSPVKSIEGQPLTTEFITKHELGHARNHNSPALKYFVNPITRTTMAVTGGIGGTALYSKGLIDDDPKTMALGIGLSSFGGGAWLADEYIATGRAINSMRKKYGLGASLKGAKDAISMNIGSYGAAIGVPTLAAPPIGIATYKYLDNKDKK